MADYKVAQIGCGRRGKQFATGYSSEPRCEIVAVADVKREAAEELAGEFAPGAAIYTDHKKMLAEVKPDVAGIALWTGLHPPVFRDCAEAGVKAVLCEKPMAPTWGESKEMVRIAKEHGVQLTFCHQRRFTPGIRQAKQWLDEGRFGKLERMDMFAPANLLDCGTHSLDLGFMFNDESPAVWAIGQIDARQVRAWFDLEFEFVAVGMVKYENGVRGTIHVGDDKEMVAAVRLIGSKGWIEVAWEGNYPRAVIYDEPGWEPAQQPEGSGQMAALVGNSIDCLKSGAEPELSADRALRAAEVIFAIYESSRRRGRIDLPLDDIEDSPFLSMLAEGVIGAEA
jgi:UDP-N-acetyl-2-amino-2-deoxyglucuronate dehydrogenase